MRAGCAVLIASATLALAACGGRSEPGNGAGIASFSQVEVGKAHLEPAPNGTSLTVQLVTSPPTVCAIAYGKTAALGSIANDPDMGGTAISHHTVVLSGLSPGTTYRYRLTATDARGQVFQTPGLLTFKTPRERAGTSRDIAIGAKVIAVSSQYSRAYRAANAFDGNLSTEWATNGDGDHAFVAVDLGRERAITGLSFVTRSMSDGTAITETFVVVADGHKRFGPFPAGNVAHPRVVTVAFRARTLRFEVVKSTGGNTGAAEIEVFGH